MKIKNATRDEIETALVIANGQYEGNLKFNKFVNDGNGIFRVVLGVHSSKALGAKRTPDGRRMAAPCWHAWGRFMKALPQQARFYTVRAIVRDDDGGRHHQMRWTAPDEPWFDWNVGNDFNPVKFSTLCECAKHFDWARPKIRIDYQWLRDNDACWQWSDYVLNYFGDDGVEFDPASAEDFKWALEQGFGRVMDWLAGAVDFNLDNADLRGADLRSGNFANINLDNADLTGAIYDRYTSFCGLLRDADVRRAKGLQRVGVRPFAFDELVGDAMDDARQNVIADIGSREMKEDAEAEVKSFLDDLRRAGMDIHASEWDYDDDLEVTFSGSIANARAFLDVLEPGLVDSDDDLQAGLLACEDGCQVDVESHPANNPYTPFSVTADISLWHNIPADSVRQVSYLLKTIEDAIEELGRDLWTRVHDHADYYDVEWAENRAMELSFDVYGNLISDGR